MHLYDYKGKKNKDSEYENTHVKFHNQLSSNIQVKIKLLDRQIKI